LFDVRTGKKQLKLFGWKNAECLGGACSSHFNPFQFYCSTNHSTYLLDERFTGKSISEWTHPVSKEDQDIPVNCDAIMTSKNG
jgi:hypothetical protein